MTVTEEKCGGTQPLAELVAPPATKDLAKTDQTALLGVALAAALAVFVVPGAWDWTSCALGITLLLIIFAYDNEVETSWLHLFAFGAVFGLCFLLSTGAVLERLTELLGWPQPRTDYTIVKIGKEIHYGISTDKKSRFEDETAIVWFFYGCLGTVIAGLKRGMTLRQLFKRAGNDLFAVPANLQRLKKYI